MDPSQIQRLKEEHEKGLLLCEGKISQWQKFKSDYEALRERLETLPNAISYDVTVPFGNNAFTLGKLVHTNEIMVLLGDNWFVEVSGKQAAAIADRRIKQCVKMLEDLQKEKEQYHNWMNYINEVSANEELVEIVEKYDEDQEKKWREQHAQNVKMHRQKLARERKNSGESTASTSEDEYRHRLESLDLTEEESESKSVAESDGSNFDYSDDTSQHSEEHSPKPINLKSIPNGNRSETDEGSPPINGHDGWAELSNGKHVHWQDLSRQNIKKITFKHSKSKKSPPVKCQPPAESQEPPLIQSPSDIYKQFGSFFPSSPPKSILKVKHSPTTEIDDPFLNAKECATTDNSFPTVKDNSDTKAFTGEVIEQPSLVLLTEKKSSRPVSHFKNSRKNRRR